MVRLSLSGTVGFKPKIIAEAEAVVKNREIAVKKAINPIYFSNCVTSLLGNLSEQMPLIGRFFVRIWFSADHWFISSPSRVSIEIIDFALDVS